MAEVVDLYRNRGYKVLAFTDHDWGTASQVTTYPPSIFGVDPDALGMVIIQGKEFSQGHHRNGLFCDLGVYTDDVSGSINAVQTRGGLAVINHPYVYTETLEWYSLLFLRYKDVLVGLEVNNSKYVGNSIGLWDNLNAEVIPQGKTVFGYGNDDFHDTYTNVNIGHFRNYNFILSDLTESSVRTAMENGQTYFCKVADGANDAPKITNIVVDSTSITITADSGTVKWVTEGTVEVGTGGTFDYSGFDKSFVRAEITSSNGITCTQPFTFELLKEVVFRPKTMYNGELVELKGHIVHNGVLSDVKSIRRYY